MFPLILAKVVLFLYECVYTYIPIFTCMHVNMYVPTYLSLYLTIHHVKVSPEDWCPELDCPI